MSTIVTRAGKGSPLTNNEVDSNFINLNSDKAEDSVVVKLSGDQTISGVKTFSSTISGSVSGNAGTATNGVVTTGSYANPSWITSLAENKVLPSQTGNSGKYLTTNGASSSWAAVPSPNNGTLTMAVSGTGLSGSASFTADQVGNSTFTVASNATNANTASTIVARDASGNFAAGTITATLSGNATTATTLETARNINLTSFNGSANITIPRVSAIDDRTTAPADGAAGYATFGFGSWDNNNTTPHADYWLMRSWNDATGGADNMVSFRKDALGMRVWQQTFGSTTAFSSFKDVAWTDGTNSSGTWGISITGNASTATSATNASNLTGGNQTGSYEVTQGQYNRWGASSQTDGNDGKIGAGLFGSGLNIIGTQTTAGTGRQIRLWGSVIDDSGISFVKNSGTWGINITGNAATATTATTATSANALNIGNSYTAIGYALNATGTERSYSWNFTGKSINLFGRDSDDAIGIYDTGTGQVRCTFDVSGNFTAAGDVTSSSDERLKNNWANLPSDFVERFAEVKSGTYDRVDLDKRQVGVGAQSLQSLMPEAVNADTEGMLSVAYGQAALVAAIELAKQVVELRKEIAVLKGI